MRLFFYQIVVIWFASSGLYSTAMNITAVVGPNNTLIFLVGEEHGGSNDDPGGNEAVVEKLLEIMKCADEKDGRGYRLFIEVGNPELWEKEGFSKDLLTELIPHADEFEDSAFSNIEIRTVSKGVRFILKEKDPQSMVEDYGVDSPSPLTLKASEMREQFHNWFHCDVNTVTFKDVFDEFTNQIKSVERNLNRWARPAQYELKCLIKRVKSEMRRLESDLKKYEIPFCTRVIDAALKLHSLGSYYHYVKRNTIVCDIHGAAHEAFNLHLFDTLLKEFEKPSVKPIVVIAGYGHTNAVENFLRDELSCKRASKLYFFDKNRTRNLPLKPKHLNMLEMPVEYFRLGQPLVSCQLL